MNKIKIIVYKKLLKEVSEKFEGAKDFINNRFDEIFSQEKLSAEKAIYVLVSFLQFMFPC